MYTFFACMLISCIFHVTAIPSLATPLKTKSIGIYELTEHISLCEKGNPFQMPTSTPTDAGQTIIVTSKKAFSIRVKSTGILDLSSFNSKNKILEFRGNAQLILEPGAQIIGGGGILRFTESSRFIIE